MKLKKQPQQHSDLLADVFIWKLAVALTSNSRNKTITVSGVEHLDLLHCYTPLIPYPTVCAKKVRNHRPHYSTVHRPKQQARTLMDTHVCLPKPNHGPPHCTLFLACPTLKPNEPNTLAQIKHPAEKRTSILDAADVPLPLQIPPFLSVCFCTFYMPRFGPNLSLCLLLLLLRPNLSLSVFYCPPGSWGDRHGTAEKHLNHFLLC